MIKESKTDMIKGIMSPAQIESMYTNNTIAKKVRQKAMIVSYFFINNCYLGTTTDLQRE